MIILFWLWLICFLHSYSMEQAEPIKKKIKPIKSLQQLCINEISQMILDKDFDEDELVNALEKIKLPKHCDNKLAKSLLKEHYPHYLQSTHFRLEKTVHKEKELVRRIVLNPKNSHLYSCSNNSINIWELYSYKHLQTLSEKDDIVYCLALDAQNRYLYSGSFDKTIKIWDADDHICLSKLEGHKSSVFCLMPDKLGKFLYSGSHDRTIKVWDLDNHSCMQTLEGHKNSVFCLAVDTKDKRLYSGSGDYTINIWDLDKYVCIELLVGHKGAVDCLVLNKKNKCLYSGSRDYTIKVWNLSDYTCLYTLKGYADGVNSLVLDVKTNRLYSCSGDQTIKIWDLVDHRCLQTLTGCEGGIFAIALDPKNNYLYSGSDDGAIRIWRDENKILRQLISLELIQLLNKLNKNGIDTLSDQEKELFNKLPDSFKSLFLKST